MARSQTLSASAQTAYAQLLDATQGAELSRTVASLPGTFARKQVKGRTYWYYQYLEVSGKKRQVYIGPENERVRGLLDTHAAGGASRAIDALARSAVALGNAAMLARHFRVVARLADYGFFRAGSVLIGTHAFLAFGNMLGVRWSDGQRTQDVDFAHAGKQLAIALPTDVQLDTHAAIESLHMGLLPIEHTDGKTGATYLDPRDPEFRIDFLTPLRRGGTEPYRHPQLGIKLQPLKFMEYLLQDIQQAAALSASSAVLVNAPNPARFALHKLIVAGERPLAKAAKSNKDLMQAAALLSVLREHAGNSIGEAWDDLIARGPGWRARALRGRAALEKVAPELELDDLLPTSARRKR
ncbi:MAG: GSU2403 family nucleotidyltransferase fold protein [Rudaea sp.]